MSAARKLPLATAALVLGLLSIPLAFMRQLCVPALIMALLAIAIHLVGRALQRRNSYSLASIRRSLWGMRAAVVGGACAMAMWLLWISGALY